MKQAKNWSLWRNLVYSLVLFGKIKTTRARAKAIVSLVDKVVNKTKKGTVASKREVLRLLPQELVVEKLTKEITPKLSSRSSGYTRLVKLGERAGDGAPIVLMEWVMDETVKEEKKKDKEEIEEKNSSLLKPKRVENDKANKTK